MADIRDILIARYKEERNYTRHHENQRATVTNVIIAMAALTLAFLEKSKEPLLQMAASLFLIGLGVFGAILSRKHYERFRFHNIWAREFDRKLREIEPTLHIEEYEVIRNQHYEKFPWTGEARLNWLWTGIHLLIVVIGTALFIISLRAYAC